MQATTARCLAGGSGSGPENDSAYFALLASSSSVTDTGVSCSRGCGEGLRGARSGEGATEPVEGLVAPAGPERLQLGADHAPSLVRCPEQSKRAGVPGRATTDRWSRSRACCAG